MKRHVQLEGVRKWAGDHLLELQSEPLKVLDGFFGNYGPYVLTGCAVTKTGSLYDVAPGLVVLTGKDQGGGSVVMVVPFAGAAGVPLPLYLTLAWEVRQFEYASGGVKPIAYDYHAKSSTIKPAAGVPCLTVKTTGTPCFLDVIQNTTRRFITDAERTKWNRVVTDFAAAAQFRGVVRSNADANTLTLYGVYEIDTVGGENVVNFPEPLRGTMEAALAGNTITQTIKTTDKRYWIRTAVKEGSTWQGWTRWERLITQTDMDNYDPFQLNEIRRFGIDQPFDDPKYLKLDGSAIDPTDYPDLKVPTSLTRWNGIRVSTGSAYDFVDIAFGNGVFIIVENCATPTWHRSTDGQTWTKGTRAGSPFVAVKWYDNQFVFLSADGSILMSPNGTAFSAITGPTALFAATQCVATDIHCSGDVWLITGAYMGAGSPTGGKSGIICRMATRYGTWTEVSAPNYGWTVVVYGASKGVVSGIGSGCRQTAVSADGGLSWTGIEHDQTYGQVPHAAMKSSVFFAGRFYIDMRGAIMSSPDGITWNHVHTVYGGLPSSVMAEGGGRIAVMNAAGTFFSSDGINWNNVGVEENATWFYGHYKMVYTNDKFWCVGAGSSLFTNPLLTVLPNMSNRNENAYVKALE